MSSGFALNLPEELVAHLADQVAERVIARTVPPPEPYIDVAGAAEHLCCAKKRIYELKESGAIPCYQDGRRPLFKRSDLDSYVAKRQGS